MQAVCLEIFFIVQSDYLYVAAQNDLFSLDSLIPGQIIGRGSFSLVYVVQSKLNSVNYALKISSMEAMPESEFDLAVVRKTYRYNTYTLLLIINLS